MYTYDLTTDIGKVRVLIPDRIEAEAFFSDEELGALASLEGSSVKRTAALALETIASDEAYVQKVIRLLDLSTNGPATAKALMERAKVLREQAALDDPAELAGFDIASYGFEPFGVTEIVRNGWRRNG